jgi:nucleotide-binding universal stress UspA family protein
MNIFGQSLVVVPVDFSAEADKAMDYALQVTSVDKIHAVHVAAPLVVYEPAVYEIISDSERSDRLHESLAKRYSNLKYKGIKFEVLFGDPGQRIAEYAKEIEAGLIVMPSHGRTGLSHLLIGSVAERVVRLAPCPVLVLRPTPLQ